MIILAFYNYCFVWERDTEGRKRDNGRGNFTIIVFGGKEMKGGKRVELNE